MMSRQLAETYGVRNGDILEIDIGGYQKQIIVTALLDLKDNRLYREQPGHSRIIAGNCVWEVKNDDQVSRIEKETGRISEHDRIEPERVWGVAASILPGI
jgi:bifunctional DNA-binding transcriptional regulator/antitoxin component of YhaV-PrlF toxin-antitoxin module